MLNAASSSMPAILPPHYLQSLFVAKSLLILSSNKKITLVFVGVSTLSTTLKKDFKEHHDNIKTILETCLNQYSSNYSWSRLESFADLFQECQNSFMKDLHWHYLAYPWLLRATLQMSTGKRMVVAHLWKESANVSNLIDRLTNRFRY